jgi:hypothetical protein
MSRPRWPGLRGAAPFLLLASAALALLTATVPARSQTPMPDLIVLPGDLARPVFQILTFSPESCSVQEGMVQAGTRRLLRFTTTYPNIGTADLVVGNPERRPDLFEYSPCHGHYHFREYADYRLWTEDGYASWHTLRSSTDPSILSEALLLANPTIASQMIVGEKRGFCIIDVVRYKLPGVKPGPAKYTSCATNQGISIGWADQYSWTLSGQWIDITNTAPGRYVLEVEVNAEHLLPEGNYGNNSAAATIRIK